MRGPRVRLIFALALVPLVLPLAANALDMWHYDLDSLTYLSTDIVITDISVSAGHKFSVVVSETLYGSLQPGTRLDTLSEFLAFYRPLEDGQRAILFLDRKPRPPNFLFPEASKSPFAVISSGVYLIDAYEHVHEYYQQNNPGPYVAEGYSDALFSPHTAPTREQDLALPSLQETKTHILASLDSVRPLRALLDGTPGRENVPALRNLLDARSKAAVSCGWRSRDAIAARIADQFHSLGDPEALLSIYPVADAALFPVEFIQKEPGSGDEQFTMARIRYLIQVLSNGSKDVQLRLAAVNVLLNLSAFRSGPRTDLTEPVPIDNAWLSNFAGSIRAAARTIFDDDSQDSRLRARCLRFLALNEAPVAEDVRKVYRAARLDQFRFAVEETFLDVNDELYGSLNPPGGPVTSIVRTAPDDGCSRPTPGKRAFYAKYEERQDFSAQEIPGTLVSETPRQARYFVLTNEETGRRSVLTGVKPLWVSMRTGEYSVQLNEPSDLPVGSYALAFEYSRDGEPVSTGYALKFAVIDTPEGRKFSIARSAEAAPIF